MEMDAVTALIEDVAAREIMPRFRALGVADVQQKSGPRDLVTVADVAAEQALTKHLRELDPTAAIIGEEAAAADPECLEVLTGSGPIWIIDPIDGTINFANGRTGFVTIVAYVRDGETIAGWIHDPVRNLTLTAVRGEGAWCDGQRLEFGGNVPLERMVGAAYGAIGGLDAAMILRRSGKVAEVANYDCGGIEYIEMLRGKRHFFLSDRSLPWDHAAGVLMVLEAGGMARFLGGANYSPRIFDRQVLIARDPVSWRELGEVMGSA
jgi:fructose-1,6-bisphosphatase/inositol monophosphatase family enzyme